MKSDVIKVMFLVLEMDLGGLQRIVNLLIKRIDKTQFIPYLCCLDRGGIFYDELRAESLKTYILQRRPVPFDRELFAKLYKILKENKIDIIHSHNGCTLYSALAGRLARVKGIVHTDHGRLIPDRRGAIWEDRLSSLMLNRFIGVSEELTEYLASVVKVSRKKLTTIINGVDTQKFTPLDADYQQKQRSKLGLKKTDLILGTVCRLDPIKNLEFLIKSVSVIIKVISECKLLIIGDGPSKKHLIKYAQECGLESKIIFVGQSSEVEKVLPVFDIYVCTSLSEGTSMTILEAMSCGLPIVASAVGGNGKLVDSTNGFLFPLNDTEAFTESIINLCNKPDLMKKKGQNSRIKAENNFSFDHVVKQYEEVYRSLC